MNPERDTASLIIFVTVSLLLHAAAAVALLFLIPEAQGPLPEKTYIVRIVPPEQVAPQSPQPARPAPPAEKRMAKKAPPPSPAPKVLERMPPVEPSEPLPTELSARAKRPPTPAEAPKKAAPKEGEGGAPKGGKEAPVSDKPGYSPGAAPKKAPGAGDKEGTSEGHGLGEKLFDKEVIASVVEKGKAPKPPDSSVTFDTEEVRHWGYMQRLKERIEYVWEYPRAAAARGVYGDLVLRFVIKKNGELGAVELVRTSGWKDLDTAAMAALKDGSPYWPLPEDWGTDSLTVTGHFIYTLQGNYIR